MTVWAPTVAFVAPGKADELVAAALSAGYNIRKVNADTVSVSFDRMAQSGMKLKEIPITFTERRAGVSKISGSIATETLKMVFKLRFGIG